MKDANAFLKRLVLVAAIGALSLVNVAYGHGGGGGKGTGGSGGGGGSASSGGHSASGTGGGHSATSSGHAATASAHSASASKSTHKALDPANVSQTEMGNPSIHVRVFRIFQQRPSTGYTTQYRETNNDDWRRKHQRLFLGFIRY
jgi:hypothetical protein